MKKETTENKQEAEGNVSQNNAITENMGNGSYTSDINPVDSSTEKKHKKKSKRTIFEIVGVIILVMHQ